MELHEEFENAHLLEQSPSTTSEHSDGSVPTVVESPYPEYLHQHLDYVHSANVTVHDGHLAPRESVPGTEGLALEIDGFQTPIGSHANVEDVTSEESLPQAPDPHANILKHGNYHNTQLKFDQLFEPLKTRSNQYPLLGPPDEKNNSIVTKVPRSASEYGPANYVTCDRNRWVSIGILTIASYATAMSGFWFSVAIWRPTWGHLISRSGITLTNASVACTLLAKSIEVSLVTAFVAFLGQKLSRGAFFDRSKGVSLAEISMKMWVVQPGSILSHFELVKCAGLTYLGVMTLSVTVFAILYTSASDALVSPRLLPSAVRQRTLHGNVGSSFANVQYIKSECQTPIAARIDPNDSGLTCNSIKQAGQGYHNLIQYLSDWTNATASGVVSSDLPHRPRVPATLYNNITVQGSWVDVQNMTRVSQTFNRIVNNVSLAFPHPGVAAAAHNPRNRLLQPADLSGEGQYDIHASVSSPTVNALCSSMTAEELNPLVYTLWPSTKTSQHDGMNWPAGVPSYPDWLNSTAVDSIFGFGQNYGRRPPVFQVLPSPYNTVLNHTGEGPDSIYILASTANASYMMCSLRASLSVDCSTRYQASWTGGRLESHCEDPADGTAYNRSRPNAPNRIVQPDWSRVAAEWALALALNDGIDNANASSARLLTELIPTRPSLDPLMPSIAEALAALAGSTLLLSALDAPFVHYWEYPTPVLAEPVSRGFNATVKTWQYQSKVAQPWQLGFYVILFGTFAVSCYCLQYLVRHRKFLADITELPTVFTLAMNSCSSRRLNNGIGRDSEKEEYGTRWSVNVDDSQHLFIALLGPLCSMRRQVVYHSFLGTY